MRARLEFQPRDLWVGLFWKREARDGRVHVWICVLPTLPLHLVFGRDRRLLRGAPVRMDSRIRLAGRVH